LPPEEPIAPADGRQAPGWSERVSVLCFYSDGRGKALMITIGRGRGGKRMQRGRRGCPPRGIPTKSSGANICRGSTCGGSKGLTCLFQVRWAGAAHPTVSKIPDTGSPPLAKGGQGGLPLKFLRSADLANPFKLSLSLRERVGVREPALMCSQCGIRAFFGAAKLFARVIAMAPPSP